MLPDVERAMREGGARHGFELRQLKQMRAGQARCSITGCPRRASVLHAGRYLCIEHSRLSGTERRRALVQRWQDER
jgi:hypothetical protein